MASTKTSSDQAVHDGYALRLHLQIVNVIDAPSDEALAQLSFLLAILAEAHDNKKFRSIKMRNDAYSMAINAAVNVANRIAKRAAKSGDYAPTREEAMVLVACAPPLDRLIGRIPSAKLQAADVIVRIKCGWPIERRAAA